jgi:hypothetical protein
MVPESIVELYIELYKSGVHCKDGQNSCHLTMTEEIEISSTSGRVARDINYTACLQLQQVANQL